VVLKLKRSDFRLITRRRSLTDATQIADRIYRAARELFDAAPHVKPYRLIGVGLSDLGPADQADRTGNLLDPQEAARIKAERASDAIRKRFGSDAIVKGRSLR
jgi:DNA polymerase-4